ncbi:MAG: hypothetical protein ACQEXQ_30040 [Bacillota bacterium]
MKKVFVLLALLSMMLCACTESNTSMQTNPTQSEIAPSPSPLENIPNPETNVPVSAVLTEQEIYDFELLRSDWTKEQIGVLGLKKEVNEGAGETYFSNELVKYIFFDYIEETTPAVVDVFGESVGPRGISVGDTFDDVMTLFPQDEDWRSNAYGVFYGQYDKYKERPIGMTGYVSTDDNGDKYITFTTEKSPWMRIFFQGDVVTHYTIYLIRRD